MTYIEFDNWDDAQKLMMQKEREANESLCPRQREIVYGSYWLRVQGTLLEYGRVLGQNEAEAHQDRETVQQMRDSYRRGYRLSMAHSILDPGGVLGDTHLAVMWPITEEEFELAQKQSWRLNYAEWQTAMLRRVIEEMRLARAATHPSTGSPQEGS